jgi:hypothetical protein
MVVNGSIAVQLCTIVLLLSVLRMYKAITYS